MWSNHFPIAFGSQHTLELTRRRESIVTPRNPNTELLRASSPTARWMREKVPAISAVTDRPGDSACMQGELNWEISLDVAEYRRAHFLSPPVMGGSSGTPHEDIDSIQHRRYRSVILSILVV